MSEIDNQQQQQKLPEIPRQQRSGSQGNYEGMKNRRSMSTYQYTNYVEYNQGNYDNTVFRQYKQEKTQRFHAEKEALQLKNRIVLLQKQKDTQKKKLKGAETKAEQLYLQKLKIQEDKNEFEEKRLREEEERERQAIILREQIKETNQRQQDSKLRHFQLKQLEVFRQKQQATLDKKRKEQELMLQVIQNRMKRDKQVEHEKIVQQKKQKQKQIQNSQALNDRIHNERYQKEDINQFMSKLEKMEMNLLNDLRKTKNAKQQIQEKIKYTESLDFQAVKQQFPDINKKMTTKYEEEKVLEDYISPYNKDYLREHAVPTGKQTLNAYDDFFDKKDANNKTNQNNNQPTSLYTDDFKRQENEKLNTYDNKDQSEGNRLNPVPVETE